VDKECIGADKPIGEIRPEAACQGCRGSVKAVHGYLQKPVRPPKFLDCETVSKFDGVPSPLLPVREYPEYRVFSDDHELNHETRLIFEYGLPKMMTSSERFSATPWPGRVRAIRLFKDGREVLEAVPDGDFDILIADLMMPGADGIQTLNEVKRLHPDRIVIIMTGYASIGSTLQAIRGGAYDYIRKPFKFEELEIVIKNASERIALIRETTTFSRRVKETVEEMSRMKQVWEEHLSNMVDLYSRVNPDERISEMGLILSQLNRFPGSGYPRKGIFRIAPSVCLRN